MFLFSVTTFMHSFIHAIIRLHLLISWIFIFHTEKLYHQCNLKQTSPPDIRWRSLFLYSSSHENLLKSTSVSLSHLSLLKDTPCYLCLVPFFIYAHTLTASSFFTWWCMLYLFVFHEVFDIYTLPPSPSSISLDFYEGHKHFTYLF